MVLPTAEETSRIHLLNAGGREVLPHLRALRGLSQGCKSLALKRGQSHVALYRLGFLLGKVSPAIAPSSQEDSAGETLNPDTEPGGPRLKKKSRGRGRTWARAPRGKAPSPPRISQDAPPGSPSGRAGLSEGRGRNDFRETVQA